VNIYSHYKHRVYPCQAAEDCGIIWEDSRSLASGFQEEVGAVTPLKRGSIIQANPADKKIRDGPETCQDLVIECYFNNQARWLEPGYRRQSPEV